MEVLKEILKIPKPYTHIGMPQPTFSHTVRNIVNGTCKPSTMQSFFAKFGYEQDDVTWKKLI